MILVTHGEDVEPATAALASAADSLTPRPSEVLIVQDGPGPDLAPAVEAAWPGLPCRVSASERPLGFCATTGRAWRESAADGPAFVYWLEHDFLHERPVNLLHLAWVLLSHPEVAQMSLMRQPVNPQEVKAGGIVKASPGGFVSRRTGSARGGRHSWKEQGIYWTTNPCLFRLDIVEQAEWPTEDGCEGRLTIALREQGYSFGVWGSGEEWVRHVGVRSGFGY